jgi:hypothetical protein
MKIKKNGVNKSSVELINHKVLSNMFIPLRFFIKLIPR